MCLTIPSDRLLVNCPHFLYKQISYFDSRYKCLIVGATAITQGHYSNFSHVRNEMSAEICFWCKPVSMTTNFETNTVKHITHMQRN